FSNMKIFAPFVSATKIDPSLRTARSLQNGFVVGMVRVSLGAPVFRSKVRTPALQTSRRPDFSSASTPSKGPAPLTSIHLAAVLPPAGTRQMLLVPKLPMMMVPSLVEVMLSGKRFLLGIEMTAGSAAYSTQAATAMLAAPRTVVTNFIVITRLSFRRSYSHQHRFRFGVQLDPVGCLF